VSAGATNLSGALSQLSEGGQQLTAGVDQVSNGVTQVGAGAEALENGLTQLSGGASSLTDGMSTLSGGISSLSTGTEALAQGSATLAEGATTLSEGASQLTALQSGVSSLTDALGQLTDGAVQLTEGSQTLSDGIDSAKDGAAQLGDGIVTAKDGVAESIASAAKDLQKTDGLSEFTGTSVSVDADPYDSVENYGSAFAPYFMNVSLWTGGLTMMMSIFLDYKRRMKLLSPDSDKPILRMLAFFGIAVGQAVLVGLTVQFILGLQINNVAMYYAGLILSSLTFTAIIQFLLIHVGDVGKIIAMILLVFQLTSTGGTFPVEMTPSFFRFLHKLMPMTYGIQFEKEAISGSSYSYMGKNALVMLGFFAVFVAATLALDYWKLHRKKTHPHDDDLDYAPNAPRLEQ
jgi:putative membrane protein